MTELTDICARIPVLPFDKYQSGTFVTRVSDKVTPAEFVAAVERLQLEDFDTKITWNWDTTRPTLRYEDGGVKVSIEGPVIRKDERADDVESVLSAQAVAA